MAADDTSYDLQVYCSVTRADDIDIVEEGVYAQDPDRTPTEALGGLGHFIRENGGPELWDEVDQYEMGSCWLRHGPGTEISYHARLDRVVERPLGTSPRADCSTPAKVTCGRPNAATFGGLYRTVRCGRRDRRRAVQPRAAWSSRAYTGAENTRSRRHEP